MNLPTTAHLPTMKMHTVPLLLQHDAVVVEKVQRRLAGRTALTPRVDLNGYRFRALIDWIEFRVHLTKSTQAQHLQSVLRQFLSRDSYIKPEDKGPGDVFSICTIRVQEPASLAAITAIYHSIVDTFGEAAGSCVTGIEVSVDAYPRAPSDAARATLLGSLQRTIWTGRDIWSDTMSRPRVSFGQGKKKTSKLSPDPGVDDENGSRSVPEHHLIPGIDSSMYLGARDDPVMIRVMDKVIDGQRPDGTFIDLADDRKRVRVEVTVKGDELRALGITDIASLKTFKLAAFQKRYFQFKLPTFSQRLQPKTGADAIHNMNQIWRARTYLRSGVMALIAMDTDTELRRSKLKKGIRHTLRVIGRPKAKIAPENKMAAPFVSWEKANRKVHDAFADLEKRELTAWKGLAAKV